MLRSWFILNIYDFNNQNNMKLIDVDKLKVFIVDKCNPINKYELLQLIDELSEESNALKEEEEKEETYTCRCGLNQVIESFSKFGINSDDALSNFNIISHEVKAEYLCHIVNKLETDNAALRKELAELKLKLKDLSK